jgi:hypothetical protein
VNFHFSLHKINFLCDDGGGLHFRLSVTAHLLPKARYRKNILQAKNETFIFLSTNSSATGWYLQEAATLNYQAKKGFQKQGKLNCRWPAFYRVNTLKYIIGLFTISAYILKNKNMPTQL